MFGQSEVAGELEDFEDGIAVLFLGFYALLDAPAPPFRLDQFVDGIAFGRRCGLELVVEGAGQEIVGGTVVAVGDEKGLAAASVHARVLGRASFAGFGAWAGRALRVGSGTQVSAK